MSQHVFISYARKDGSEHAARFDTTLHQCGFKTWRDKRGIDPTQDFTAEIENAIEAASHVVVCITPDVRREDSFVRREIQFALLCDKPIYVARFADVKPPISVVNNTWLDFFKGWDAPFEQLVKLLKTEDYVVPTPEVSDPYKPYLETLYKQIVNYLDKTVFSSLPGMTNTPLLELTGELTPEQVDAPPTITLNALPMAFYEIAGVGAEYIPPSPEPYRNFHDAFNRYDGRVLLLGEPGGGKTTTLFAFARDKVAERLEQPDKPLPILVPIVTWNAEAQTPLADWLAQTIPALKDDVAGILREGKALLLLDGLDELGAERPVDPKKPDGEKYDPRLRFMSITPTNNQLLITCRVKDYEEVGAKLALQGAVTLRPLDDAQMKAYLRDLPELWKVLENDKELREVARIPLLLSFFAYAFTGLDKEAKSLGNLSRGDVRDKIFEIYVKRRYEWEERKAAKRRQRLPFSLHEIRDILGKAAYRNMLLGYRDNILHIFDFIRSMDSTTHLDSFIALSLSLNILVQLEKNTYRFIHLLLRNYFVLQRLPQEIVKTSPLISSRIFRDLVIEDVEVVNSLIHSLNSSNVSERNYAAIALASLGYEQSIKRLITMLDDHDAQIADTAFSMLIKFGHLAVETLIASLKDQNINVCIKIITILGSLRDNRATESLTNLLKNDCELRSASEWELWNQVIEALYNINTPEANATLKQYFLTQDKEIRKRWWHWHRR